MKSETAIQEKIAIYKDKLTLLNEFSEKEFDVPPGKRNAELLRFYYVESLKYRELIKELEWVWNEEVL